MRVIDLSKTLSMGLAVYPGDPEFKKTELASIERDGYRLSRISMSSHSGTHIDAPSHYIEYGKKAKDIELRKLIGECAVAADEISALDYIDSGVKRLLVDFAPGPELERELLSSDIELLGTSSMTIGNGELHYALLERGIAVVENLELGGVSPGLYYIFALPIRLDADGAPARVILIDGVKEGTY